jgi:hypothetical protein
LGDNSSLGILDRLEEVTEDCVGQLTVAVTAEVAGSLVNILRGPEGTIGNINVESQASAWLTNRGLGLDLVSDGFG